MDWLLDFLFCPVHGIFSPLNWGWVAPTFFSVLAHGRILAMKAIAVAIKVVS